MSDNAGKPATPYVSLSADYNSWQRYFYANMREALEGMEAEIRGMARPGERDVVRLLWARLQSPDSDHEESLRLYEKYAAPHGRSAQYVPIKLDILGKIGRIDEAIDLAGSYLLAGREDMAPYLARFHAMKAQPAEAAELMRFTDRSSEILENFFQAAPDDDALFEDFAGALEFREMPLQDRLNLIKWLNIRGKFTLADLLALSTSPGLPHPAFHEESAASFHLRGDSAKGQPLIITFPPMEHKALAEFCEKNSIDNIESLNGSRTVRYPHFFEPFNGINLLHMLDDYQAWGLLNIESQLFYIKKLLYKLEPSKIITFGSSSGGFASILYGFLLDADLAIATAPQTVAFHDYKYDLYHDALCQKYSLACSPFAYLHRVLGEAPEDSKTQYSIYYSSQCPADIFHASLLENMKNMHFHPIAKGNSHGLIYAVGKGIMQERIREDIRKFCGVDAAIS